MPLSNIQLVLIALAILALTKYYFEKEYSKQDIFKFYVLASLILSILAAYGSAKDLEQRLNFIFFAVIFIAIAIYYYAEEKSQE